MLIINSKIQIINYLITTYSTQIHVLTLIFNNDFFPNNLLNYYQLIH